MNKNFNYDSNLAIYKRIIKEALLPNIFYFSIAIVLMLICSASVAYRAYLMKPAIDDVFVSKNIYSLMIIPLKLIGIAVLLAASTVIESYIMNKTNMNISISYQKKLFSKLLGFDIDYFQNKSSNKVLTQFADIEGLMSALNLLLTGLIKQFFTIVGLVGLMFYQSFSLSCIAFIGFPLVIYPVYLIGRKLKKLANKGREIGADLGSTMGESMNLIELVKSNNCEEYEMNKFTNVIQKSYKLSMKMIRKSLITSPMMEMVGSIGFAGVIWYGGYSVINGTMTSGAFFTFIAALFSVYKPAKSFAGLNIQMQTAIACARRLYIVLDRENAIKDKENAIDLQNVKGDVELKNVVFNYPFHDKNEQLISLDNVERLSDKVALDNISLKIEHGKSVALVGHSGSGKSTIFKLLLRFYDPIKGAVNIDGTNIKDITLKSLRRNISVVSQDVLIFNASVWENIKYGTFDATNEQIIQACKMANADEFINELEDGYDTILGPNGCVLSGGQKQRISIARAILKNAPILLLDEATSALDPISEKAIQKALATLMKDRTTIIIAHRLTTVQNCDKIFVLQEGHLMEQGNHEELLNLNGLYANLYKKQFEKAI